MGKKKRNGISRQTIPREQKLDPDSSDEDSGDQAAGAFKIEPDTVLKLDDDDHSTVSGGASDDTYTYSQRELPVAIAKHIADIHDDERIERVTERMQRMETVSGWNRGRALKEVGVEIPKDDKLYAKEFTPTKDPWATSDDPNPEDQPWTKPIPEPAMPRTKSGNQAGSGASNSTGKGKSRVQKMRSSTSKLSKTPSDTKMYPTKNRGFTTLTTTNPSRNPSAGTRALGDRTNSGSYAAVVSGNSTTDEKPRTVNVEQRKAAPFAVNSTGVNTKTHADHSRLAHPVATQPARVTSNTSTLSELAKQCEQPVVPSTGHDEGKGIQFPTAVSNSNFVPASTSNIGAALASGISTLRELANASVRPVVPSPGVEKSNGTARKPSAAAAAFKPGVTKVLHVENPPVQDDPPRPAALGFEAKTNEKIHLMTEDPAQVARHLLDRFIEPGELQGSTSMLRAVNNNLRGSPNKVGPKDDVSNLPTDSGWSKSLGKDPETSISNGEGKSPSANVTTRAPHSAASGASKISCKSSSSTKIKVPADKKTILHDKPSTMSEPGSGIEGIIYTATTTTTPTGAKVIEVDNFEYDYLYPLFTVEVRPGEGLATCSHTVAWYHPHGVEHGVISLEDYLQVVFNMTEISLFVDYKCDNKGKKVRADVFWPGLNAWVLREVREREGMGV